MDFDKQKAEVLFAVVDGTEVGFALFFHNFSTFLGRAGLYLEDLFVMPEYRGKGRFEWVCLDWNKPSIDFYLSLGAEPQADWTIYRMSGDTLTKFAE